MSAATLERNESVDLTALDRQHQALREELSENAKRIRDNPAQQAEFLSRVDQLLEELQRCVPEARTTTAANVVNRIASEWQMIFTSELRIPRNIYALLKIEHVPVGREPTLCDSASPTLSRDAIIERIRERAYFISKDWKVSWLRPLLFAFKVQPERIHALVLQLPARTPADDWYEACTCLACDVLDARIDLALQLGIDGFEFLENVWLEDVKRLKAFLHWEASQPDGQLDDARTHYDCACLEIHKHVLDPTIKSGAETFLPIELWLRTVVLDGDRINTKTRPYAHQLVEKKAHRLAQRTQSHDANANWSLAEQYVRAFYENLIPAVVQQDRSAIESVLAATTICPQTQGDCEIVNALEVALITYFFNPTLMEPFFKTHATYL